MQYLAHLPIHTYSHTLMAEAAVQSAICSSGAMWGSETLQHAAGGARDSNHLPITGQTTLLPVNVLGAAPLMYYPPVCCLVIPIQSLKAFQKITN